MFQCWQCCSRLSERRTTSVCCGFHWEIFSAGESINIFHNTRILARQQSRNSFESLQNLFTISFKYRSLNFIAFWNFLKRMACYDARRDVEVNIMEWSFVEMKFKRVNLLHTTHSSSLRWRRRVVGRKIMNLINIFLVSISIINELYCLRSSH